MVGPGPLPMTIPGLLAGSLGTLAGLLMQGFYKKAKILPGVASATSIVFGGAN
jgi:hypothetical protein